MLEVKSTSDAIIENDFYYILVDYVRLHSKLPISIYSKQRLNYYVKILKSVGILHKIGYNVWSVDVDRYDSWQYQKKVKKTSYDGKNIRGHGFSFKLKLPKILNWNKREEYLKKENIPYVSIKQGQRIILRKNKIWLCRKSIIIYYPEDKSYYASSALESKEQALYDLYQLFISLENLLRVNLRINKKFVYKISKRHFGKIHDCIAKKCNKESIKIVCYYNGKGYLVIDDSLGLDETEAIDPLESDVDMDKIIVPIIEDWKIRYKLDGQAPTFSNILGLVNRVVINQDKYAENMISHIKAVQELGKGVNELRHEIKKISTAHLAKNQTKLDGFQ